MPSLVNLGPRTFRMGGLQFRTNSATGIPYTKTVAFVENATSVTHTGTVPIPAGAFIHNIIFTTTVLWTDTSAAVVVGDSGTANGWFASTNLAATDLLVGEVLSIQSSETWGGKQGAFMVAATGRKGSVVAGNGGLYYGVADSIIAVVSVTTPSGTAGRSFLHVTYSIGTAIAPVVA